MPALEFPFVDVSSTPLIDVSPCVLAIAKKQLHCQSAAVIPQLFNLAAVVRTHRCFALAERDSKFRDVFFCLFRCLMSFVKCQVCPDTRCGDKVTHVDLAFCLSVDFANRH